MFIHGVFLSKSDESASGCVAYASDAGRKARGPVADRKPDKGASGRSPPPHQAGAPGARCSGSGTLALGPRARPPCPAPARTPDPRCPLALSDLTRSKRNTADRSERGESRLYSVNTDSRGKGGPSSSPKWARGSESFKGRTRARGLRRGSNENPQSWSVERQAGRVCQPAVTEVRTGSSHRKWETRALPFLLTFQRNGSQSLRETLWAVREPSSQLQALLNECCNKGHSSDLPGGSVVKTERPMRGYGLPWPGN